MSFVLFTIAMKFDILVICDVSVQERVAFTLCFMNYFEFAGKRDEHVTVNCAALKTFTAQTAMEFSQLCNCPTMLSQ